jgi:hypothetical protein
MRLHCGSLATRVLTGGDASWKPSILVLSWLTKVVLILHNQVLNTMGYVSSDVSGRGTQGSDSPIFVLGVGFIVVPHIRGDECATVNLPCPCLLKVLLGPEVVPVAVNRCERMLLSDGETPCSSPMGKSQPTLHVRAPIVLIGTPPQAIAK